MIVQTVDIGNTLVKVGSFEESVLKNVSIFGTVEEAILTLNKNAKKTIISSVREINRAVIKGDLFFLTPDTPLPFSVNYTTPITLGNDRRALAAGAIKLFPQKTVLVIDIGTCITYDLITNKHEYLGGSISPGVSLRYKSMYSFTDKLPLLQPSSETVDLCGDSTTSCMHSGVMNGLLFEIEETIVAYRKKYPNIQIILTGGDSIYFEKQLKATIFAAPNLIHEGLCHILNSL
ncbi:MAG: type III pantothenate kinase [Cyclobacteriaceae bacterium]